MSSHSNIDFISEHYTVLSRSLRARRLVDLTFYNLSYTVIEGKNQRAILNNISGICPGGQVTAILGSSGSGKKSLLNILAARVRNSEHVSVHGVLQANGERYDDSHFAMFASYVMQEDVLFESFTPRQAFTFSANLKFSDPQLKMKRVDDIIKQMKLESCQNSLIGGVLSKGISGGERRRTSIGYELVSNPSCLLLDEPTSGLDSFTAFQIINHLRLLAAQDRTIVFTIHQPSSDIFKLLDRIILLVKGNIIYQGNDIVEYFDGCGFRCPLNQNPMEFIMSISELNHTQNYKQYIEPVIDHHLKHQKKSPIDFKRIESSLLYQIVKIAERSLYVYTRTKATIVQKFAQSIFLGLLIGGCFWQVGNNDGAYIGMFNVTGCLFFSTLSILMSSIQQVVLQFATERDVYLREENAKLYSTLAYFIGKSSVEVPFLLFNPILQQLILYWMVGLNSDNTNKVLIHLLIAIVLSFLGNSLGLCIGCTFRDLRASITTAMFIITPLIAFSGFYANQKYFYNWMGWMQYLSPIKYGLEAFAWNEFKGRYYDKDPLEQLGLDFGLTQSIALLMGMSICFRYLAYIQLNSLRLTVS